MPKILVVDDEPKFQKALAITFRQEIRKEQYSFQFAPDGESALELAKNSPEINLVVIDINMPEMDGLTFLEKLKDMNPTISTIVITGYDDKANMRRAFRSGATDFISKSINAEELKQTIVAALTTTTINTPAPRVSNTKTSQATEGSKNKERKVVRVDTITSLAKKLSASHRYSAVVEIIEKQFSVEQIENLQSYLSDLKLVAQEKEKEKQKFAREDFEREQRGELPLHLLESGHIERRLVPRKLKNGRTKYYGPYYYLRHYDSETGKLACTYLGTKDPREREQ
jgi:CheY-like chemotaxis protein